MSVNAAVLTQALLRTPYPLAGEGPTLNEFGDVDIGMSGSTRPYVAGITFSVSDSQPEVTEVFQDWQLGLADWMNGRVDIGNAELGANAALLYPIDSPYPSAVCGTTIENVAIKASAIGDEETNQDHMNVVAYGLCEDAVNHLRQVMKAIQ
jgi:hypothetical protein